jgi:S1-C subfamily serine protease
MITLVEARSRAFSPLGLSHWIVSMSRNYYREFTRPLVPALRASLSMRNLTTALVLPLLFAGTTSTAEELANRSDHSQLKAQIENAIGLARPTIVRFAYGKGLYKKRFGCGVIVSPEGHIGVSGPVQAVLDNDQLELRLSEGRIVRGEALGWSSELGCGMLKITEEGPWPYVKVESAPKVGQVGIALGFPNDTAYDDATSPSVELGIVTRLSHDGWMTTSHRLQFRAAPIFDLQGKLLGLKTSQGHGFDATVANASLISDHWDALVAGKNLDRERLFKCETMTDAILAKVKAASVRLRRIGKEKSLVSGIIVTPEGHIITCGHHDCLPGEQLQVLLHDGRSATATVLGTNLQADVGVMKINNEGPWPHAKMGHSATMGAGAECTLVGYPTSTDGVNPWVYSTDLIPPSATLPRRDEWHCEFWTRGYPEDINGVSGGGVFDAQGNVVGVILGGSSPEMQHARIELFRKNWKTLTARRPVDELKPVDVEELSRSLQSLSEEFSKK